MCRRPMQLGSLRTSRGSEKCGPDYEDKTTTCRWTIGIMDEISAVDNRCRRRSGSLIYIKLCSVVGDLQVSGSNRNLKSQLAYMQEVSYVYRASTCSYTYTLDIFSLPIQVALDQPPAR